MKLGGRLELNQMSYQLLMCESSTYGSLCVNGVLEPNTNDIGIQIFGWIEVQDEMIISFWFDLNNELFTHLCFEWSCLNRPLPCKDIAAISSCLVWQALFWDDHLVHVRDFIMLLGISGLNIRPECSSFIFSLIFFCAALPKDPSALYVQPFYATST